MTAKWFESWLVSGLTEQVLLHMSSSWNIRQVFMDLRSSSEPSPHKVSKPAEPVLPPRCINMTEQKGVVGGVRMTTLITQRAAIGGPSRSGGRDARPAAVLLPLLSRQK